MGIFSKKPHNDTTKRCSFCCQDEHKVRKLIAGPAVFICDECIKACNDIIADDARAAAFAAGGQTTSERAERSANETVVPCADDDQRGSMSTQSK